MADGLSRMGWAILSWPRVAALACGLLAATGFPPLGLWPLALVGLAGMVAMTFAARDWKHAARLGWLFGVAHFTFANNWVATAFSYQGEMPVWLGWVAVPLLALYLAVYPAIAAGLARAIAGQRRLALALAFGGSWALTEWLRSWVFTGYSWDPLGLIFLGPFDRPGLAALLPWTGTYALSGLAALIGGGVALLIAGRAWWRAVAVLALVAVAMVLPGREAPVTEREVAIVQPGFRQEQIDDPTQYELQFQTLSGITVRRRDSGERLVLWPESGLPDYLRPGYPKRYYLATTANGDPDFARKRIAETIGAGSLLLTGAVDLEIEDGRAVGAYNAITALDDRGRIVGSYSKAHLVPYGEYLALRWLLEPLGATRLVAGTIDFLPGPGPRTVNLGRYGSAGMQVCYEIIFAGQVVDRSNRPDFIFNPSNEAWFGSFASPQFLAQSRMRAIEEGLPVLRATVNGISAVIDPYGSVRHFLPTSFTPGRIDARIPESLPPTLFARFGNALSMAWAALLLALSMLVRRRRGS